MSRPVWRARTSARAGSSGGFSGARVRLMDRTAGGGARAAGPASGRPKESTNTSYVTGLQASQ
ncbi:hypothetical protein A4V12_30225 [Streptomyces noursei]|nr:hypothetical protein A4V12_30225 [Streptomyces noursei]